MRSVWPPREGPTRRSPLSRHTLATAAEMLYTDQWLRPASVLYPGQYALVRNGQVAAGSSAKSSQIGRIAKRTRMGALKVASHSRRAAGSNFSSICVPRRVFMSHARALSPFSDAKAKLSLGYTEVNVRCRGTRRSGSTSPLSCTGARYPRLSPTRAAATANEPLPSGRRFGWAHGVVADAESCTQRLSDAVPSYVPLARELSMIATGLTGEPVAPTSLSGVQTKKKRW
jgi:hypothetical protein